MRRLTFGLSLVALLVSPSVVFADGLDVDRWLRRPGVKMLAVEFYATWCKPCMEAVPRWKALHEKYREDGLRLVVVATQDPQGGCVNPGWNPDDVVCDDDGRLAERFGASRLPAAYLWSWDGSLLVRQQHVEEVQRKIEAQLEKSARVAVEVGAIGKSANVRAKTLEDLVRARLRDEDKLTIVSSDAEQKRLDALRKKSLSARYDERMQCEIGAAISANTLLEISVTTGRRSKLRLALSSAERGCLVASAVVDWNKKKPAVSVAEGVALLMAKLRRPPQMPWMRDGSGNVKSGVSSYEKMARELAAAKAKTKRLEDAWRVVRSFATATSIDPTRRADALKQFLRDFPRDNPHAPEAKALLAKLTPAQRPPPIAVKPPPPPKSSSIVPREVLQRIDGVVPPGKITFKVNKAVLRPRSLKYIDRLAGALHDYPAIRRIEVSCHSDSRGSDKYNLKLTQSRAAAVRSALLARGIDPARVVAAGYGETKPIASNATAAGRQKNRRIEIRILERD